MKTAFRERLLPMIPELKEVPQRSTPKDIRQLLMSF